MRVRVRARVYTMHNMGWGLDTLFYIYFFFKVVVVVVVKACIYIDLNWILKT